MSNDQRPSDLLDIVRVLLHEKRELVRAAFKARGGYPSPFETAKLLEKSAVALNKPALGSLNMTLALVACLILSDQFCVYEPEPKAVASFCSNEVQSVNGDVLAREVAMLVHYYENPHLRKPPLKTRSLQKLLSHLLLAIAGSSERESDDLHALLKPEIVGDNFPPVNSDHDPCMNEAVDAFREIQVKTACPFAPKTKYWGAPHWQPAGSEKDNWERIIPDFRRFLVVGKKERFDGYVVAAPEVFSKSFSALAAFVARSLETLSAADSQGSDCLKQNIESLDWSYDFEGETMFISAFGTCYKKSNPRHTFGQSYTFLFFQPDYALRSNPSLMEDREMHTRRLIAEVFERANAPFSNKDALDLSLTKQDSPLQHKLSMMPTDHSKRAVLFCQEKT